jgi:hypothetical protein
MPANDEVLESLDGLVGEWTMGSSLAPDGGDAPRAVTTFEWLPGRRFLVQRWEIDVPEAPDGIAIIGFDTEDGPLVQHYFDSRGVARVYMMTFADGRWTLERIAPAPDFSQRFTGTFGDGGETIDGVWEISHDRGVTWATDFTLTYTRTH